MPTVITTIYLYHKVVCIWVKYFIELSLFMKYEAVYLHMTVRMRTLKKLDDRQIHWKLDMDQIFASSSRHFTVIQLA